MAKKPSAPAAPQNNDVEEAHIEPSAVTPVDAPAGSKAMGERLVGQTKATAKWHKTVGSGIEDQFIARRRPVPRDFYAGGEHFDQHPAAYANAGATVMYVANKLVGDSRISRDTPLNHIDLYSSYKNTPHAPASMWLKYLVHRINHVEDYEDPSKGHNLDLAFRDLVTKGGAADKNGHISLQDLHEWTARHAPTIVPQLLAEKAKTQMDVARGIGLNVRSINGEPHVALTRGLNSDMMENEHPLSSHADLVNTGFGREMYHSWVPLKDLWFAYDLDRTMRSHASMGPEDEYLVSNTGTRYEAQPHDVKKSRIKSWNEEDPYIYDDASDEELASMLTPPGGGEANLDTQHEVRAHPNAGPAVYAAFQQMRSGQGYGPPGSGRLPPLSNFGHKWYPREAVMAHAANPNWAPSPAWFRNPNLTSQDLETLAPKLFANPVESWSTDAANQLLDHPAMNSHLLERLWKSQNGSPWSKRLLESPLATHQMREDAIEMAKFQTPAGLLEPARLMRAVTDSPHHTSEQALKVYDWSVANGAFSTNPDLAPALARAKLPAETMLKLYDRADELWNKEVGGNAALGLKLDTRVIGTPDEQAERVNIGTVLTAFAQSNPQADVVAQLAASRPGRIKPRVFINRMGSNGGFLESELQAALISELVPLHGKDTSVTGLPTKTVVDYLEMLAESKKLTQDSISYLAHYPDIMVRDNLFRNKSVTPEQLREAYPKSMPFPERPVSTEGHGMENVAQSVADAYWRRKNYEAQKATRHFIKPLPQNLAKSSNEDLWQAKARDWLANQTTTGFYTVVHKDVADGALRDKAIEPQFTDEVLDGEAIFARPATPENLNRLQREAGPDDVVLFFETEVEPQQHTDGSLYWTGRVPCNTIQMADLGDEPLAKMHTPLTFPKLGVGDDRRETKLVTTPLERKTFMRAAAQRAVVETGDPNKGAVSATYKKFNAASPFGSTFISDEAPGRPSFSSSASFAQTSAPRRKSHPDDAAQAASPGHLSSVAVHEDLHRVFSRIQHKHGDSGREMLARNLMLALPQDLQSAVMKNLHWARPDLQTASAPEEEALTELGSYLNQAPQRDQFHAKQQHSPEQQRAFHDKMKRAYRLLQAVSATAGENWLHHEKPWMERGVAMRKFTEPQSGTGLSAAEAHEVFKGSLKLSKSHPDLLDPNAFAFKFETDPAFMEAVDARNRELQLRKMALAKNMSRAAFRHRKTRKVYTSGIIHNADVLPEPYDEKLYEDGFVDHNGKFLNRKQAALAVGMPSTFDLHGEQMESLGLMSHDPAAWVKTKKSEADIVLPHETVLKPGEESAAKVMLGHRKDHETALKAARFLTGCKEPVDENLFRLALSVYDGDFERAALIAVGLTDSEANMKALAAVLKLGEFSHEATELSKNEPGTPHIESVNPGAPDAAGTADEVRRGVTAGLVQPLKLGGKHSKGSMAVRDPKTGNVWLLKPGAGKASPAAGVRDGASSQSAREAAFWHCMDRTGLGNYGPRADLLEVNGGQVAAMKLLGVTWKPLDEQNRKVDGWAREILQPYLDRGDVHRLAALLWALGESDAHGQNLMTHAEAIALIDHGSAFAGPNFNPGRDSKSFTPYFLRVFAPSGYTKKKPEDRIAGLPVLTPAGDSALKKWVQSIDPALISETMGSHGIGKVEQEAVLERLNDLQHHAAPSLSRYVNELWAGVVLPPHLRS